MSSARTTAAATKKKKKKKKKSKPTRAKPQKRHLLDAIKAKSVDAIVDFYIAAVDATHLVDPANGDNPIHTAIRTANEPTLKAVLLLFGSEYLLSKKNKADETPLQLAKQFAPQIRADLKLYIRSYEGLDTSLDSESTTKRRQQANPNDGEESTKSSTIKGKQKVMLTLDGGGIRGLVSTRVLMIIERHLGKELWPLVGWCTGTSTGALLACALGTGKSLDQCQRLYFDMKNKVFRGRRPYSSKELEKILMESLTKKPLNSIVGPKLLITACRGDVAPPALVLFRNYQLPPGLSNWDKLDEMGHIRYPENTPIWYAARCSSAAPSYFPPCDGVFVDGGLMCNNPTIEALTEIVTLKTYEDQPLPSCVLSIGTGTAPTRNLALKGRAPLTCRLLRLLNRHAEFMRIMIQCLMKQISESNVRPVAQARAFCRALAIPFFRFSPTLTRDVRIDEVDNAVILEMLWDVELVMAKSTTKRHMRELICLLSQIA